MKLLAFPLSLALLAASTASGENSVALFARGEFAAAAVAARGELAREPADAGALLTAGTVALYENDLGAAEKYLATIPAGAPQAPRAARLLSEVRRRNELKRASGVSFATPHSIVPFASAAPLPAVAVEVNGRRALFQIDTGAPGIAVDRDFAASLALPPAGTRPRMFANGVPTDVPQVRVASVRVGGATLHGLRADVLPLRAMNRGMQPGSAPVDGVLGMDVFERFARFTLDYANGTLRFDAPGTPAQSGPGATVPLWLVGDHFLVTRGELAGIGGDVLIDTGLAGGGAMPSGDVVRRAHLALGPAQDAMAPNGLSVTVHRVVVPTVRVGSALERNVPGFYGTGPSPLDIFPFALAGVVSHEFFRRRSLTVDFEHMRLAIGA